jgi:dihydroorotase
LQTEPALKTPFLHFENPVDSFLSSNCCHHWNLFSKIPIQPNLVPPITTVQQCLEYRDRLQAIEPNVDYIMSLYLHESITPEVIREAKKAGITGVKSYPAGVTTVSTRCHASIDQF